jgi:hypothetical protein
VSRFGSRPVGLWTTLRVAHNPTGTTTTKAVNRCATNTGQLDASATVRQFSVGAHKPPKPSALTSRSPAIVGSSFGVERSQRTRPAGVYPPCRNTLASAHIATASSGSWSARPAPPPRGRRDPLAVADRHPGRGFRRPLGADDRNQSGCCFISPFCVQGNKFYTKIHNFRVNRVKEEMHYVANKIRAVFPLWARHGLPIPITACSSATSKSPDTRPNAVPGGAAARRGCAVQRETADERTRLSKSEA